MFEVDVIEISDLVILFLFSSSKTCSALRSFFSCCQIKTETEIHFVRAHANVLSDDCVDSTRNETMALCPSGYIQASELAARRMAIYRALSASFVRRLNSSPFMTG